MFNARYPDQFTILTCPWCLGLGETYVGASTTSIEVCRACYGNRQFSAFIPLPSVPYLPVKAEE